MSYLSDEAFIERGVIYNSSFSELVFRFSQDSENRSALELKATFTDEDTILRVNKIRGYQEDCIFDSAIYLDETIPNHQTQVFKIGEWEEALRGGYHKLKGLFSRR